MCPLVTSSPSSFIGTMQERRKQRTGDRDNFVLAIFAVFSLGCVGIAKDAKIKCPKCGAVCSVEEGQSEMQKEGGPGHP